MGPGSAHGLGLDALRSERGLLIAGYFVCGETSQVNVAELPIKVPSAEIGEFCRARGIRKLSLFGSVLRDDFDAHHSDVDVLAEFEPGVLKRAGFDYFGYGEELSALFGSKVDFCSRLHPLILERVKNELLTVYERA